MKKIVSAAIAVIMLCMLTGCAVPRYTRGYTAPTPESRNFQPYM